jgi:hypothetical protein
MIPNWDYKVEKLDELDLDTMENNLNDLGKEGWELVSFDGETGIFKRKQLSLVEPYTGSGTHKKRPEKNSQPEVH